MAEARDGEDQVGEDQVREPEKKIASLYPVPSNSCVIIASHEDETVKAEDLLAIIFQIASGNPNRKVKYWIKIEE